MPSKAKIKYNQGSKNSVNQCQKERDKKKIQKKGEKINKTKVSFFEKSNKKDKPCKPNQEEWRGEHI